MAAEHHAVDIIPLSLKELQDKQEKAYIKANGLKFDIFDESSDTKAYYKARDDVSKAISKLSETETTICDVLGNMLSDGSFPSHWMHTKSTGASIGIKSVQDDMFKPVPIGMSLFEERIKYPTGMDEQIVAKSNIEFTLYDAVAEIEKLPANSCECVRAEHVIKIYAKGDKSTPICTVEGKSDSVFNNVQQSTHHDKLKGDVVSAFNALYGDAMDNGFHGQSYDYIEHGHDYGVANDHLLEVTTVLLAFLVFLFVCIGSCVVAGIGGFFLGRQSMRLKARNDSEI